MGVIQTDKMHRMPVARVGEVELSYERSGSRAAAAIHHGHERHRHELG